MRPLLPPIPCGLARVAARIAQIKARFRDPPCRFPAALASARASTPADLPEIIAAAAARHRVDPDLLLALAQVESGLRPDAVSPSGARGVMQLMPDTARRFALADPFDPWGSADAGARYLREQLDRFDGDIALALAAYNAGPAAVARFGGIPPYRETRAFVSRVLTRLRTRTEGAQPPPPR